MTAPLDRLAFQLRSSVPWAWEPLWPRVVRDLVSWVPEGAPRLRALALAARYPLSRWVGLLEAQDVRESLYVLDVLDRWVLPRLTGGDARLLHALDVGSKNGCYLPGLVAGTAAQQVLWDAVEVDAHRRYVDLSTRRTYALRLLRGLGNGHRYLAGDVSNPACGVRDAYGLITWWLPFVTPAPLHAWGLPAELFSPERLLASVLARLAEGGWLLLVNQGEDEHAIQQRLLQGVTAACVVEPLGLLDSVLSPFRLKRWGILVHRPPSAAR